MINGINQFKESSIFKLKEEIARIGGNKINATISLCHHCHYHVPAYTYERGNQVFIVKNCSIHGLSHFMIESDSEFYFSLDKSKQTHPWIYNNMVMIELTDRCNLECPHCYHLPDNKIKDRPIGELTDKLDNHLETLNVVCMAGAEASLRKDFKEVSQEIAKRKKQPIVISNGIKFSNEQWVKNIAADRLAGRLIVNFGLNHPSYLNNPTIREKQIKGIKNSNKHLRVSSVGYTLVSINELDYVLNEILTNDWGADYYRVRCGSEIGRNVTPKPVFVSELYKHALAWAEKNKVDIEILDNADNNVYHVMLNLGGRFVRLINWCDETNIDMEELRTGPWNDFVPHDGITNFLHQIIRRDVWKNRNKILPDKPPERYLVGNGKLKSLVFDGLV